METALQNTGVKTVISCPSPPSAGRHTWAAAQSRPPQYPEKKLLHSKQMHTLLGVLKNFEGSMFSVLTKNKYFCRKFLKRLMLPMGISTALKKSFFFFFLVEKHS